MQPITITLTRYAEPNWLLIETLKSLSQQTGVNATVLFLDQKDDKEIQDLIVTLGTNNVRFIRELIPVKSLSYARNIAFHRSPHDLILFIDSDAIAEPTWAQHMVSALSEDDVAIVGGRIILKWYKQPFLLTKAGIVREQYSGFDMGAELKPFHKVVGASFGANRQLLGSEAYFDETLGRKPGVLLGGEETDLCKRATNIGLRISYQGLALVYHQVLPDRISYSWMLHRFFYAGVGRASMGGVPSPTHKMDIWTYLALPVILPFYLAGFMKYKLLSHGFSCKRISQHFG